MAPPPLGRSEMGKSATMRMERRRLRCVERRRRGKVEMKRKSGENGGREERGEFYSTFPNKSNFWHEKVVQSDLKIANEVAIHVHGLEIRHGETTGSAN